jgi:ABC-type dipeptide/oligopeptide/nickel transport system permease component
MRLTRSGMLDVLKQDYIRTARSKGLREQRVIFKHALKNASISIITVVGLQFGQLMSGSVITETVFAWPGVASLAVTSIRNSDFPVVQTAVVFLALIIVLANLCADLLIGFLDPRIRYE